MAQVRNVPRALHLERLRAPGLSQRVQIVSVQAG